MSANIPGTRTSITNQRTTTVAPTGNAVVVVGVTSSTSIDRYDGTVKGAVYTVTSFSQAIDLLGLSTAGTWNAGSGTNGPYDATEPLLRALEMVYLGNPGAKVYFAGVNGAIADTTTVPAGTTDALNDTLEKEDAAFVVISGTDPVAAGVTHAELAADSSEPYNSPRFYVTGLDMFSIDNDGAGSQLDNGLQTTDVTTWSSAATSSEGLTLAYIGNHEFAFQTAPAGEGTVEIGGQYVAAYLAGVLSGKPSNFAISYHSLGFGKPQFSGSDYNFTKTELNDMIGAGWIMPRYWSGRYVYAKGVTLTSDNSWELYPHRQITNTVQKTMVANVGQFLGKPQTPSLFSGAQKIGEGVMTDFALRNYIGSDFSVKVEPHATEDDAIRVRTVFETIKPVHRIYLDLTIS